MKRSLTDKLFLFFVGLIFSVIIFVFMEDESINEKNCKHELEVKGQEIKGVVILKYLNERKNKHFKYVNSVDTIDTNILAGEGRFFYDYLVVGDSVLKRIGSLELKVKRQDIDSLHILSFDCEEP